MEPTNNADNNPVAERQFTGPKHRDDQLAGSTRYKAVCKSYLVAIASWTH